MDGLNRVIEQVSKEKGISTDSLQETIEQAMVAAARSADWRDHGAPPTGERHARALHG